MSLQTKSVIIVVAIILSLLAFGVTGAGATVQTQASEQKSAISTYSATQEQLGQDGELTQISDNSQPDIEYGKNLSKAVNAVSTVTSSSDGPAQTSKQTVTTAQNLVIENKIASKDGSLSDIPPTAPVRVQVKIDKQADFGEKVDQINQFGEVVREFENLGYVSAYFSINDVNQLQSIKGVKYAQLESAESHTATNQQRTTTPTASRSDPSRAWESMHKYSDAHLVHDMGFTGSGATVAVLDTGVYETDALDGKIVDERDFTTGFGSNVFDPKGQDPTDYFSHGSNVAGIIASSGGPIQAANRTKDALNQHPSPTSESETYYTKGVAPGANIINAKVFQYLETSSITASKTLSQDEEELIDVGSLNGDDYLRAEAKWNDPNNDIDIDFVECPGGTNCEEVTHIVDGSGYNISTETTGSGNVSVVHINTTSYLSSTGKIDKIRINGSSVSGEASVNVSLYEYDARAYTSDIARAINWSTTGTSTGTQSSPEADIISTSISASGSQPARAGAIEQAVENGTLYVSSAGNAGNGNQIPQIKDRDDVIAVGAINRNGSIAGFSQKGADVDKPDLVAPGVSIPSAGPPDRFPKIPGFDNNGTVKSGTSMSTPYVSGAAALYIDMHREIYNEDPSPEEIKAALTVGAVDSTQDPAFGSVSGRTDKFSAAPPDLPLKESRDDLYGAGTVNIYNTYTSFVDGGEGDAKIELTPVGSDFPAPAEESARPTRPEKTVLTWLNTPSQYDLSVVSGPSASGPGEERFIVTSPTAQTDTYEITRSSGNSNTNGFVGSPHEWALATTSPPTGSDEIEITPPSEFEVNATESAAFAVPVGQQLPSGEFADNNGPPRFMMYQNDSKDFDLRLEDASGTLRSESTIVGEPVEQVVADNNADSYKVIYEANFSSGSSDFAAVHNHPMEPLPSTADIELVETSAGNASKPGQIEFNLLVENAGNPYSYIGYGEPVPANFTVTVGDKQVSTDSIVVEPIRADKYNLRVSAPTQRDTGNYNLTVEFTDEKFGASHTAKATATDAIGYSGEGSSGATAVSLIMDRSGSMRGDAIGSAKDASSTFLQQMRGDEYIGVVAYDGTVENISEMKSISNNRSQINNSIYGISAFGSTDIGNGLKLGRQNLDAAPKGTSKAAILLTDGNRNDGPSRSQITNNIVPKYEASGYDVYSVAFGSGADEELLKDIANVTDDSGNVSKSPDQRFYSDPNQNEIQQIYQDIRDVVSGASKIQSTSGTVSSNSDVEEPVPIDDSVGSTTVNVNLNSGSGSNSNTPDETSSTQQSQGGSTETKLYDPNDQLVKKNDSTATGTERSNVEYSKISGSVTYRIDDPQSGDWSYEIVNNLQSAVNYDASVSASTSTTLGIATDAQQYTNGSTAELTATVLGSSGSVSGATVVANITTPDGSKTTIQMAENSPGTYTTDISLNDSGQYSLTVTAQNGQVSRTKTTQITSIDPATVAKVKRATQGYNLNTTLGGNISTKLEVTRPSQPQGGSTVGTASNTDSSGSSDKELSDFESAAQELALGSRSEIKNASVSKPLRQAALTIKEERSNQNISAVVDTNLNAPSAGGGPSGATVYVGTTDFEGPDNDTIPADRITISPRAYTATKGQTRDVTVDIDVPTGIQDGNYTGNVTLTVSGTSVEKALKLNVTEGSVSVYTNRIEQAASNWKTASTSGKEYYEEQIADELTSIYFAAESGGS